VSNFRFVRSLGAVLVALAAAACGDDELTDVQDPESITATAAASADLSTLVAALTAADLATTLEGAGPFTVFAPRNAAFDALGAEVVDGLLADANFALLSRVLRFHVVAGDAAGSGDLTDGQTLATVEGGSLTIRVAGGSVTVNGASVLTADIEASNGIVHIIDEVLLPPSLDAYETAVVTDVTTDLASLLAATGLDAALQGAGPFTVFAPVDEAFSALGDYPWAVLNEEENVDLLSKILTFHVVSGEVQAGDLTDGGVATTLEGGTLNFDLSNASDPKVNGASIIATDIQVANGVIHLVDKVLLPELNVVETATLNPTTATLVNAIVAAELVDALSAEGPFTIFAPGNDAFELLGETTVSRLLDPANRPILQELLTYHVVPGDVRAADLTDGMTATTLEGNELTFDLSDPSELKVDGARIVSTDIVAGNGVIHLVDAVLFGGTDLTQRATVTNPIGSLADAIAAADLAAALQGAGPFTVFAPVDEAFEALGTDKLERLFDTENRELLQKILTYHVVPGEYGSQDLTDGMTLTTAQGGELTFDLSEPGTPEVNGSHILQTDLAAENGVIHFISDVLVDHLDVVDVATIEGLPTLVGLVEQQGLAETLRGDNGGKGYTVFAPTEAAFAALEAVPTGQDLTEVLLYHVVSGTVASDALSDGQVVAPLLADSEFTVNVAFGTGAISITDAAGSTVSVTVANLEAANGLIHVIEGVLDPTQ